MSKKWRKRLVKFLIVDLSLIIILLGSGLIYQQVGASQDEKSFTPLASCMKYMAIRCICIQVEKAM